MTRQHATVQRKINRETRAKPDPGFPQMGPRHYLEWLEERHQTIKPSLYFEIGTESGASLSYAQCPAIAVDPVFKLSVESMAGRPELHLFQQTSDAFFESGFLKRYNRKVDFAFLDGMHQVEFLLRDFINTERHMARNGTITMHDCVPMSFPAAERVWDKSKTRRWTGDVWKLVPILREYRPDLKVEVLDLAPSGIVKVDNLDPTSMVLKESYDEITQRFVPLTLEEFGLDALKDILQIKALQKPPAAPTKPTLWEESANSSRAKLRIAIKTPRARQQNIHKIVDHAFARSLADGLLNLGHSVRIDSGQNWYADTAGTDFDLVLRGRGGFEPQPEIPHVMWAIYPGKKDHHQITAAEVTATNHCFFASEIGCEQFRANGHGNVSTLMQGFDPRIMHLPETEQRDGMVFVGSNHFSNDAMRPIIEMAHNTNHDVRVWGSGWVNTKIKPQLQAKSLPNFKLGDVYRCAKIVLCDHMEPMRLGGYVSNRIFDALACGAAVISDDIQGLPPAFSKDVFLCRSQRDFTEAVHAIEQENDDLRRQRMERSRNMQGVHSLFDRAAEISKKLIELKTRG